MFRCRCGSTLPAGLLALLVLAGCEGDITPPGGDTVESLLLQPNFFTMTVGESRKIDVLPKNSNGTVLPGRAVAWASSAPGVVSVDEEGIVTALAEGRATITARVEGHEATAEITVLPPAVGLWRDHTCAISQDARVYCWGRGINGQLGSGGRSSLFEPTGIMSEGSRSWMSVASGAGHSCALDAAGVVSCWGRGFEGQLGTGERSESLVPVDVPSAFQFRAVTAGERHTCALSARDTRTWCWGWNAFGQIGNATNVTVSTPVAVVGAPQLTRISAGGRHTCGVDGAGGLWCWGANSFGQLGDGSREDRSFPVRISPQLEFRMVGAGARHTCAIDIDARLHCWGENTTGQLGNGTLISALTPGPVVGDIDFVTVSAGSVHTCVVAADQRAFCWGLGSYGR
ncbi:MAG: Ig-like domain-containing protein, partial [Gemmatimonadetes bacterium]|nr:Ig-like domain-containing protein [Gemmatimonadota bacterium]